MPPTSELSKLLLAVIFFFCVVPLSAAENIKIGVPSITVTSTPLLVARDAGFFQQEGFSVELIVMPAAMNIKVLLSGDIQYATTVGSAVVASVRGINVRTVMVFVDKPLLDLVGAPGVSSMADLKGKTVGISSRGGLHDVSMRRILSGSKLDPAQVTVLTVGAQGAMFAAVKSGRIAAGLLNPPFNFMAHREGMKSLAFAGDFLRLPSTGIVTLTDVLERAPEQTRRLLRAQPRPGVRHGKQNQGVTDPQTQSAPGGRGFGFKNLRLSQKSGNSRWQNRCEPHDASDPRHAPDGRHYERDSRR